jgi:hypothetical protein
LLGAPRDSHSGMPQRRPVSFAWQFCFAGGMSQLKCRLNAFFSRFIETTQQKSPKNANEEN